MTITTDPTTTMTFTTDDVRATADRRWPLAVLGLDRAEAARLIESHGYPTPSRATCGWTPPRRIVTDPDPSMIRHLLLGALEPRLKALAAELRLSPGDARRIIDLAEAVARQCVRPSLRAGERVVRIDGHGTVHVVVGTKPKGFMEAWKEAEAAARSRRGDRSFANDLRADVALVWTVDPARANPGISQSPADEWHPATE